MNPCLTGELCSFDGVRILHVLQWRPSLTTIFPGAPIPLSFETTSPGLVGTCASSLFVGDFWPHFARILCAPTCGKGGGGIKGKRTETVDVETPMLRNYIDVEKKLIRGYLSQTEQTVGLEVGTKTGLTIGNCAKCRT